MTFTMILFGVIGLCFGSFSSVLIARVPQNLSIGGRSQCSSCKTQLRAVELIPLLSFLYLRGACRTCKTRIGYTYPFIEIASGLVFVAALYLRPVPTQALALSLALWLLLTISIIDIRTHLISDAMNIPFVLLAIIASVLAHTFDYTGIIVSVAFFGAQWLVSRGKWLGSGDIILGAGVGALVGGWERMLACLFLTYVIGALIASTLLLTGTIKRGQYVAFGPFLALGALVSLFAHTRIDQFISLYLGNLGM